METMGVVARRYIDFLILLIPTPIISALFCYMLFFAASLLFVLFFLMFFVLICDRISENEPYCTYNNYATAADK